MRRALQTALFLLTASGAALGAEPPTGKASFPLPTESEAALPVRVSSLDRRPTAVAALPLPPPATPPAAVARGPAQPRAVPQPRVESTSPSEPNWEVVAFPRRRSWARGPDDVATAPTEPSSRDRDRWMLSIEGATRAPIDAGLQVTFETPPGLRLFGGYGWVPGMYRDSILGAWAAVSSDPVVTTILASGFQGGRAWRVGAGWRPFRNVGVYLDAGYARVDLHGELATADLVGVPGFGGTYAIESSLGFGFVELGYQAKIAERVVLALAIGATKVMSAETRATPTGGTAEEPLIDDATAFVDEGLEKYGFLPTLTLRLGVDLI